MSCLSSPEANDSRGTCLVTGQATFGELRVQTFLEPDRGVGYAALWHGERRLVTLSGGRFGIGERAGSKGAEPQRVPMGEDITGDGTPDLLLIEYTGGAHCCYLAHVIALEDPPRPVAVIDALHTYPSFRDLRGVGVRNVVLHDWTFAYWRAPYADSPAPRVILTPRGEAYHVDLELMEAPAPSLESLEALAKSVRSDPRWQSYDPEATWNFARQPPSRLWGTMLELVYTGHPSLAMKFFEAAWPKAVPGKRAFLADFRSTLASSPHWPTVSEWGFVE